MIALDIRNMIGFGGREQGFVDMRTKQQLGKNPAVTIAKAIYDDPQRPPRVLEGFAAGQERVQDIYEDDLSRITPEVILVESAHRFALVDLETLRHEGAETVRRGHIALRTHIERSKPEKRRIASVPRHRNRPG